MRSRSVTPGSREKMLLAGWRLTSLWDVCLRRPLYSWLSLSARLPTSYGRSEVQGWEAASRLPCPEHAAVGPANPSRHNLGLAKTELPSWSDTR